MSRPEYRFSIPHLDFMIMNLLGAPESWTAETVEAKLVLEFPKEFDSIALQKKILSWLQVPERLKTLED